MAAPLALPLSPDSGQYMRLRGGAGPWEGYLEVRSGKDRPWGHVCDISDNWTLQEASVVCRHLGFLRYLFLSFLFNQSDCPFSTQKFDVSIEEVPRNRSRDWNSVR